MYVQLRIVRNEDYHNLYLNAKRVHHILFITATKETAFVHAISAAGVMYTLTKNCSLGNYDNCGCDDSKSGKIGKNKYNYR